MASKERCTETELLKTAEWLAMDVSYVANTLQELQTALSNQPYHSCKALRMSEKGLWFVAEVEAQDERLLVGVARGSRGIAEDWIGIAGNLSHQPMPFPDVDTNAQVHSGFYNSVVNEELFKCLEKLKKSWRYRHCRILLTGHSRGAAVSSIVSLRLHIHSSIPASDIKLVTFNSPKLFDDAGVALFLQSGIEHHRFYHNQDIVSLGSLPSAAIAYVTREPSHAQLCYSHAPGIEHSTGCIYDGLAAAAGKAVLSSQGDTGPAWTLSFVGNFARNLIGVAQNAHFVSHVRGTSSTTVEAIEDSDVPEAPTIA